VQQSAQQRLPDLAPKNIKASPIPTADEDREVAHSAYMLALEDAQNIHIEGMMEFASGVSATRPMSLFKRAAAAQGQEVLISCCCFCLQLLARAKIPSQQYSDPLMHIFDEFDTDGDNCLSAQEVAAALRTRSVMITDEQAEMFVRGECVSAHGQSLKKLLA
jgi:hypothetical protein